MLVDRLMHRAVALVGAGLLLVTVAACTSSDDLQANTVSGIITEVSGGVSSVTGFVVLSDDATSHKFVPQEGLLFLGGPLSHLRDHLVTGEPVVVDYELGDGGELIAVKIDDE